MLIDERENFIGAFLAGFMAGIRKMCVAGKCEKYAAVELVFKEVDGKGLLLFLWVRQNPPTTAAFEMIKKAGGVED